MSDLQPISYPGFTNMLQRVFGSFADYYPLHDKPIASVGVEEDGHLLVFRLVDGRTLTYAAQGDCCSNSWVEHITVPPDIAGTVFTGYSEQDMGETRDSDDWEVLRVYQTAFQSPKGEVVVEYRNSSNGYYGGWLEGPREQWAIEETEAAREALR